MDLNRLQEDINHAWDGKLDVFSCKDQIEYLIELLDSGQIRAAEKINGQWLANDLVKKAILLSFKISNNQIMINNDEVGNWFDKIPCKFADWTFQDFFDAKIRAVPGSFTRRGSFIAKNVILMPSFVNIGAYIDEGTMIDSWATIGSCAQIGKNCHISGGVGIGGVLEPIQATPVIIEDNCFIGARSEIAEGVIVKEGSVISMGVFLGMSTKIYNRLTQEITYGTIPAYSVVVPGTIPSEKDGTHLYAAIIVKQVDEKTRSKTSINSLLRDLD